MKVARTSAERFSDSIKLAEVRNQAELLRTQIWFRIDRLKELEKDEEALMRKLKDSRYE